MHLLRLGAHTALAAGAANDGTILLLIPPFQIKGKRISVVPLDVEHVQGVGPNNGWDDEQLFGGDKKYPTTTKKHFRPAGAAGQGV